MAMLAWRVGWPSAPRLVATIAAILFTIVGQLTVANWSSLSFPRKLEFGQMRGQRQSGMAVLVAFGSQILTGAISGGDPAHRALDRKSLAPCGSLCVSAAAAVGGYAASLDVLTCSRKRRRKS